jgi:hypothetical protein
MINAMIMRMRRLRGSLLPLTLLLGFARLSGAQEAPPSELPRAFDPIIQQMQFETPTRIAGLLLSFDPYDDAIWLRWTHRHAGGRWLPIPTEMEFAVYPRDPGMMEFFRSLKPGTALRMTIQKDQDGKRRVLELDGT